MMIPDIKALSFNCKGLTNPDRAKAIQIWLKDLQLNLDVLCLNEVKTTGFTLESNLKSVNRSFKWFSSSHSNGRGGVCLGLNGVLSTHVTHFHSDENWVSISLSSPFSLTLVAVYAPSIASDRKFVWNKLAQVTGPVLMLGDFNMVTSVQDRWNKKGNIIAGAEDLAWKDLYATLDLQDVSVNSGLTWSNNQAGEFFRAARLDRFYCSLDVVKNFALLEAKTLCSISISDHWPVLLVMSNPNLQVRSGWFHADQSLFKFKEVRDSVEDIFNNAFGSFKSPSKAWSVAVKDTQSCLRSFKKKVNCIRQKKRADLSNRILFIQNSTPPSSPPSPELQALKADLRLEELLEAHRALIFLRESWAGKIDKPNKEMFRLLKQKQARDIIPNLLDDSGATLNTKEDNLDYVFNFYSDIFSSPPTLSCEKTAARASISRAREKTMTDFMQNSLEAPISLKEVSESILSLANGKSPGMDGLPNEFFKTFHTLLAPYILLVWQESYKFGALPTCVNTGVIKLIHKKEAKNVLHNWRPITCMNTIYKVFALCLSKRLSPMMDSIILKSQKGFIKGRFILDTILNLWEGCEYANDLSLDFLFLKIDFDKAYDRVEWDFILQSLHDIGCGRKFIKSVQVLLGNATTHVSLNGNLTQGIKLQKSIRQGCPLAPLLFVIAADALGWLVQDKMQHGLIKGIPVEGFPNDLCLEQFADDTNALLLNDPSNLDQFLMCLELFCRASGSVINHHKTGCYASSGSLPKQLLMQVVIKFWVGRFLGSLVYPWGSSVPIS